MMRSNGRKENFLKPFFNFGFSELTIQETRFCSQKCEKRNVFKEFSQMTILQGCKIAKKYCLQ